MPIGQKGIINNNIKYRGTNTILSTDYTNISNKNKKQKRYQGKKFKRTLKPLRDYVRTGFTANFQKIPRYQNWYLLVLFYSSMLKEFSNQNKYNSSTIECFCTYITLFDYYSLICYNFNINLVNKTNDIYTNAIRNL